MAVRTSDSERSLARFIDDMPVGVATLTADVRCIDANEFLANLLRCTRQSLIGRNCLELVHPDDLPMVAESIGMVLVDPTRTFPGAIRLLRDDGTHVPVEANISVITEPGDVAFVLSISNATVAVEMDYFVESTVRTDDLAEPFTSIARAIEANPQFCGSVHWNRGATGFERKVFGSSRLASLISEPAMVTAIEQGVLRGETKVLLRGLSAQADSLAEASGLAMVSLHPMEVDGAIGGCVCLWSPRHDSLGPAGKIFASRLTKLASLALSRSMMAARLRSQALSDPLTGLANRTAFLEAANDALRHDGCCVVLLDVDQFKPINDTYGHGVGDEVLEGLANMLREVATRDSTVARLGGDEFAILVPGAISDSAIAEYTTTVAEAFRTPLSTSAGSLPVSLSIGAARGTSSMALSEVMAAADTAMYTCKRAHQLLPQDGAGLQSGPVIR